MTIDPSPEAWAQARFDYEQTDKPVGDICFELGVSPNTLRDRVRRWAWTPRRQPIAAEGPPPPQPIVPAVPLAPALVPIGTVAPPEPAPPAAPGEDLPPDPAAMVRRLQGAVSRVLPAIEATLAKLAAGSTAPREMERAARTLTSLTRTLRELNELLSQHQPVAGSHNDYGYPDDIDAFRNEFARRINAFVASRTGQTSAPPEGAVKAADRS